MWSGMLVRLALLVSLSAASLSHAQVPVAPEGNAVISNLFDSKPGHDSLRCSVHSFAPFLDFTFRYEAGYAVAVHTKQFVPGERLYVYLRATPEIGAPALLGESLRIPPLPPGLAEKMGHGNLKGVELDFSGAIAVGTGHYRMEFLLMDGRQRSCRAHWSFETHVHKAPEGMLGLKPNEVAPMQPAGWSGKLTASGVRLTVLLDAAPINPDAPKLYAWDRMFLLQTLSSLLKQLPCQSVRLVVFNLEHGREIFRQDRFDRDGFERLEKSLREMELGTISYKALRRHAGPDFLAQLAAAEASRQEPSDAVVFLGPSIRIADKVPREMLGPVDPGTRLYYFEYFPWGGGDFPDSIDLLTRNLHGSVFKIHSADELGQSIQKLLGQVQPGATPPDAAPR